MGRWGYRVFEGDVDLDLAIQLGSAPYTVELNHLVFQSDMLCELPIKEWYQTEDYAAYLETRLTEARTKLDDKDTGTKTLDILTSKLDDASPEGKAEARYLVVLFGALMMRCGAKVTDDQKVFLRGLASRVPDYPVRPIIEYCAFRTPGKLQYMMALENYKSGTPRSFHEPSCFNCGKISSDLPGKPALLPCGDKSAHYPCLGWYCNEECRAADKDLHDHICRYNEDQTGRVTLSLNV